MFINCIMKSDYDELYGEWGVVLDKRTEAQKKNNKCYHNHKLTPLCSDCVAEITPNMKTLHNRIAYHLANLELLLEDSLQHMVHVLATLTYSGLSLRSSLRFPCAM